MSANFEDGHTKESYDGLTKLDAQASQPAAHRWRTEETVSSPQILIDDAHHVPTSLDDVSPDPPGEHEVRLPPSIASVETDMHT